MIAQLVSRLGDRVSIWGVLEVFTWATTHTYEGFFGGRGGVSEGGYTPSDVEPNPSNIAERPSVA